MLAAQCWLEARGISFADASQVQMIGALREVWQQKAAMDSMKALVKIAAFIGIK